MLRKLDHQFMGGAMYDWLNATYHFSYADYFNQANINFGVLRVLNDNTLSPHSGFEECPHKDIEILTYVISGTLTHTDSMGNHTRLTRGQIQYMCAGSGITHREYNDAEEPLRVIEIWITPDEKDHQPTYGVYHFDWEARHNEWLHMASDLNDDAPITLNQDINIYTLLLDQHNTANINVAPDRQAYLLQIEGFSEVNGIALKEKDALEVISQSIEIKATHESHFIVIEMKKTDHPYL